MYHEFMILTLSRLIAWKFVKVGVSTSGRQPWRSVWSQPWAGPSKLGWALAFARRWRLGKL